MQAFTTNRFDAQQSIVRINSSEIKVSNTAGAVEIRFIDEAEMLDAVCAYIAQRYWSAKASQEHEQLINAVAKLGEAIRSKGNN